MANSDGSKKLQYLNLENALSKNFWRDFPYDKGLLEKNRDTLKAIINLIKVKNIIDDEISGCAIKLIDEISEMAAFFMDIACEKSPLKSINFPSEGYDVVAAVVGEIDEIYNHIVDQVGFSSRIANGHRKRKKTALSFFQSNQAQFRLIKNEHLNDNSLYADGGGQEKRNFYRKLLQLVIIDQGFGEWSADLLQRVARIAIMMQDFHKRKQSTNS